MALFGRKKESGEEKARTQESRDTATRSRKGSRVRMFPRVTEKTSRQARAGTYVFMVPLTANKIEIAQAVSGMYGVEVTRVNVVNSPGKVRTRGRIEGWKSGFRKAMVTLKEGHTIEAQ